MGESKGCDLDMYNDVCHTQFESASKERQELREMLQKIFNRLFVSNGDRALTELVRDNRESRKRLAEEFKELEGKFDGHVSAHEALVEALSETQQIVMPENVTETPPEMKEPVKTTKISFFRGLFSGENITAMDVLKLGSAFLIIAGLGAVLMKLSSLVSAIRTIPQP